MLYRTPIELKAYNNIASKIIVQFGFIIYTQIKNKSCRFTVRYCVAEVSEVWINKVLIRIINIAL